MGKIDEVTLVKKIIGKNIRGYRESKLKSIEELAERARVDEKNLGKVERGKGEAKITALLKVAPALGVTIYDLLEGTEGIIKRDPFE